MPTETLVVDGFSEDGVSWFEVGNSPYLDVNDGDTNKVNATDIVGDEFWFSFQNLSNEYVSVETVVMHVVARCTGGGAQWFEIDIQDENGNTLYDNVRWTVNEAGGAWIDKTEEVFTLGVNTEDAVNNLRIRLITAQRSSGSPNIHITQVYIVVNYIGGSSPFTVDINTIQRDFISLSYTDKHPKDSPTSCSIVLSGDITDINFGDEIIIYKQGIAVWKGLVETRESDI